MLNRTNRTLSAHSNRLNHGTRSLALVAGVVNVATTLRTSAASHPHDARLERMDSMRGAGKPDLAIPGAISGYPRVWFPSSSTGVTAQVCSVRPWGSIVAEYPPVEQEVITSLPSWPTGRGRDRVQARARDGAFAAAQPAARRATPPALAAPRAARG